MLFSSDSPIQMPILFLYSSEFPLPYSISSQCSGIVASEIIGGGVVLIILFL
jgi:hypothetical protein